MPTFQEMVDLWTADGLLYIPLDRVDKFAFDLGKLQPEAAIPAYVPYLFTAYLDGSIGLFNILEIEAGDEPSIALLVIGAVPDEPLYYCINIQNGSVLLLDTGEPAGLEVINSSPSLFLDFLYQLELLIRADQGKEGRRTRATTVRQKLTSLDRVAFSDKDSWWSMAFEQLTS